MRKFSLNRLRSRRQALKIGIGVVTALTMIAVSKLKVLSYVIYTFNNHKKKSFDRFRTFKVAGKSSLKQRAKAKGLIYGAFLQADRQTFDRDSKLKSRFTQECDLLVAGLYWDRIRPSVTTFDFSEADYFAKVAAERKMLLRGHPLVWHMALPKWLPSTLNRQNAQQILTNHIQTVVGHYAGKIHSWDVVNEAIDIGRRFDNLTNSPWLEFLGPDYIELAFRIAAQSDPQAILMYNDNDLEHNEARQIAVYELLKQLKSKGTPIHALGLQSHLSADLDYTNLQSFKVFLRNVSNLGLKIAITELDVIDKNLPVDISQRDRMIAATYEDYLNVVLAEKSVIAVINWGLSDRYTWITGFAPRSDRSAVRPLPFDRDMKPKLVWNAIARAFDRAPKR
jgi:endo-1,4-beta-xylanase